MLSRSTTDLPLPWRAVCAGLLLLATLPLAPGAAAAELIVDNADSAVQVRGNWSASSTTAGFVGADYLFRVAGDGAASVFWPFPNGAAGRYEVFARWSAGPNRAANATFEVSASGGAKQIAANQKSGGGAWQLLGAFDFEPNKGQGVRLTDKADGVVVADAIRFVGPSGAAPPARTPQPAAYEQQEAIAPAASAQPVVKDARYFDQTRYRIDEDAFWEYYRKRGGVRSFGYPVSNTFALFGMKVQIFQRQVLQLRPDGVVQTMNLLDEGLMPYSKINGSTLPAPDRNVYSQAPRPEDPNYHEKMLQFVREVAPDSWDGEPVNFARTFFSSVRREDAYPSGVPEQGEALLPYFNLELWGLPTSRPMREPTNPGFIYQRFQRGIMHYDKACGCTQGLLLADYFKALLTNRGLPADLAEQAKSSNLLGQYAPNRPQGLARPAELPGSNLQNAFRRDPNVTLDAGHGASEIGASHTYPDGTALAEKDLNLRVMLRARDLLQEAGYQVTVTRTRDTHVNSDRKDLTGDGKVTISDELQARVDVANSSGADIFVSVHFNGISDPDRKGTYVFWDPDRPFADRSKALAELVDQALVKAMKDAGYSPVDHGATRDTSVLGGEHYFLLSPKTAVVARPSEQPAIIGEGLFLTNDDDANALRKDSIVEAIARGYVEGIKAYFLKYPVG
ncbi:MAG: N-acetylmuramoyl-L-alanine amidase [Chloroflexota bacterium]|nr:N-acetylmuramoyl-L-alanine amidase [Chloroflexota bacterium]